ncbi:Sperm receptor for egg jelly [Phytophthora citrophthora]|uniref:Sperm receptor for egg jelly n=1 Tax=Phytophthora citrophthora TaxID=4793 RepID=A0AAD9GBP5_9STRA|nr:Sperm receptor for egg jelly [Phytophthora citrophthora]
MPLVPVPTTLSPATTSPVATSPVNTVASIVNSVVTLPVANPPVLQASFVQPICRSGAAIVLSIGNISLHDLDGGAEQLSVALSTGIGSDLASVLFNNQLLQLKASESNKTHAEYALPVSSSSSAGIVNAEVMITAVDTTFRGRFNVSLTATSRELFSTNVTTASKVTSAEVGWFSEPVVYYGTPVDFWFETKQDTAVSIAFSSIREKLLADIPLSSTGGLKYGPCRLSWDTRRAQAVFVDGKRTLSRSPVGGKFGALVFAEDEAFGFGSSSTMNVVPAQGYSGEVTVSLTVNAYVPVLGQVYVLSAAVRISVTPVVTPRLLSTTPGGPEVIHLGFNRELEVAVNASVASRLLYQSDAAVVSLLFDAKDAVVRVQGPFWRYDSPVAGGSPRSPNGIFVLDDGNASVHGTMCVLPPRDFVGSLPVLIHSVAVEGNLIPSKLVSSEGIRGGSSVKHAWLTVFSTSIVDVVLTTDWNHAQTPRFDVEYASSRVYENELAMVWISHLSVAEIDATATNLDLSVEVLLPQRCSLSVSVNGLTILSSGSETLDGTEYKVVQVPVDSKAVYVAAGTSHCTHVEVLLRASVYAFSSWNMTLVSVMFEFLTVAVSPLLSVEMMNTSISENSMFSGMISVVPTKADLFFRVEVYSQAGSITLANPSPSWSTNATSVGNLLSSFSTQWEFGVGRSMVIPISLIPIETMSGSLSVDVVVVTSTVDVAQSFFTSECYLHASNRKDVLRCLPPTRWKSIAVSSQLITLDIYPAAKAPRFVVTPSILQIREDGMVSTTVSNWALTDVDGSENMYLQLYCIPTPWQKVFVNSNPPSAITSTGSSTTYELLPLGVYRSNASTGDLSLQLIPPAHFSGYIDCSVEAHSIDHSGTLVSEDVYQVPLHVMVIAEATVPLVSMPTTMFTAVEDEVVVCDSVEASLVDTDGSETLFLVVDLGEYDSFVTSVTWRSDELAWPFWTLADDVVPATMYRSPSQRIVAAEAWRVSMRGNVEIALVPGYSGELDLSITSVSVEKLFFTWATAWNTAVAISPPIGIHVAIRSVPHIANMTLSPISVMAQPLMAVPIRVTGSTIDTDSSEVLSTQVTVNRSAVVGLYVPNASENWLTDADTVTLPRIPAQAVYQVDQTFTVVPRADFVGFFMVNVTVLTTELATGETKAVSMTTTVFVTPVEPVVRVSEVSRGRWNEFVQLPFQRLDEQQEVAYRDHVLIYVENRTQVADIYAGFQRLIPVPLGDVDVYEVPYSLQDAVSVRPLENWYGYMQLFAIVTTVAFDIGSAPNRTAHPGTGDGIVIMDLAVTIHPQAVSPSCTLAASSGAVSVAGKPISLTFDGVLPYNSWDGSLIGWMVSQLAVAPLSAIDTVLDSSSVSVVQVALHGLEVYGVYSTGYEFSDTHLVFLVGTKPSYARAFIATVTTDTTDILQQSVVTNVSNLNVQLIGEPDRGALGFGKAIRVFQVKYNQNVTFRLADLGLMSELTDLESVHAFILANAVDAVTVGSTQLSGEADSHWGAAVGLGDLRYELYGSRSPECFPTDPFCLLNRVVTVTPRKSTVQTFDITMRIISKVSANSSSFNSLSAVTTFARCRVVVAPAPNTTPLLVLNSTAVAMMEDVVGSFMLVVASTSDRDESNVVEVEVSFDPQFLDGIQLDGSAVVTPTTTGVVVLISRAEAVVSAMNRVVSLVPHRNYAGNFSVQVFVSSIERSTGTSNQISTNVSVNVTAVADAPALKVSSTDIRVNQSVPGELTIISAALMDDDGSESLRLELIDPVGALQAAEVSGGGKFVKDHEGGRFVLTPLPLAASTFLLRLNGTASWFGSTQLQLNAVSREASNGNEAVSSINVVLTVLPVADPPTVVVENPPGQLAQAPRIVVTPSMLWVREDGMVSTTVSNWALTDVDGSENMYLQLYCIPTPWQKVFVNSNPPSAITSTGSSTTYELLPLGVYRSNASTGDLSLQLIPPAHFSGYIDCSVEAHSIDHSGTLVSEDVYQVPLHVMVIAEATVPLVSMPTTMFTAVEDEVVVCDSVEASLVDTDGSETLFLVVDLGEYDSFVTSVTWRSDELAWPFWTLADDVVPATMYRSPSQRIVAAEAWRVSMRGNVEIALVPGYSGELDLSITSVSVEKLFFTWATAWNTAVAISPPIGIHVAIRPVPHIANMTLSPISVMAQPLMAVPIRVTGSTIDTDSSEVLSTQVTVNRSAVVGLYVPNASENWLTDADTVTLPRIPAQAVYQVDQTFTVVPRADFVGFFMVNVTVLTTELATGETKAVSMTTTVFVTPVEPVVRVSEVSRGRWNEFVQLPFQRLDEQQEVAYRDHVLIYVENRTQVADIYAGFQRLIPVPLGDVDVYEVPYSLQDAVSVRPLENWYGYMQLFAIVTTVAFDIGSAPNRTAHPGTGDGIVIMDLAVTIHPQAVSPSCTLAASSGAVSVAGKPISLTFDGVLPYNSWDGSLIGWMVSQLAVAPLSAIDTVLDSSSVSVVQVALHGLEVYGVYSTGYEFSDTHLVFLVGTKPSYARAFIATVTTDTTDILQQSVVTNVSNLNVQLIGEPDRGALGFGKAIRVFQVKYNQNVTFRLADLGLMSELTDLESVHAFILANAVDAVTVGSTQLSGEADSHWGAAVGLGDLRYELYGSRSPECFPTDPFCLLNRVVTVTPRKSTVQTFDITMRIISKVSANSSSFNSLSAVTTFARCRVVVAPAPNTTPLLVLNSTAVAMMEDVVGSFMLVVASTSDRDESNVVEVEVSFDPQFLDGIQLDGSAVVTPTTTGVVVLISRAEAVVSAMNRVVSLVPHRNYAGNFSVQVFVSSIERSTGTSNQISTNVSVNVTAVADAPALKVSSTDIRVNQSVPGELTIISAALMDDDGSESLRLELIDPVGALQAAEVSGGGKFVKDHEGGRFVLTPLPLAASTFLLRLNGTASWFGSTQLQLNAVSREASNGNEAVSSINVVLTVLPVADPPTVVVENPPGQLAQAPRIVVTPSMLWVREDGMVSTTVSNWALTDVDGSENMYLQLYCIPTPWQKVFVNSNPPSAITSTGSSTTYELLPLGVYRSNASTGDLSLQLIPPAHFSGYIDCSVEAHSIDHSGTLVSEDVYQVPLHVMVIAEATVPLVSMPTTMFTAVEDEVVVCDSVEASLVDTDGSETLFLVVDLGEYDSFVTSVTWRSDELAWPFWTLADDVVPATMYRSPSQRIVAAEAWRVSMRGNVEIALVPGYSGELDLSITSVSVEKLFFTWATAWNTAVAISPPIGIHVAIRPVPHIANMTLSPISVMAQPLMAVPIRVTGSTIDTDSSEVLSTQVTVNRSAVVGLYVPNASENWLTDADTVTLPRIPAQAVYQVDQTFTVVPRADFVGFFMVNVTVLTTELATGETKAVSMTTTVFVTPVEPVVRVSEVSRGRWNEFVQLPFQRLDEQQEVAYRDHVLIYVENRTQVADIYAGFQRLIPVPLGDVDVYEVPYSLQDAVSVRPLENWYGYMQLFAIVTTVAFDIGSAPNRTAHPGTGDGIVIMDLAVTIHPQAVSPSCTLAASSGAVSVAGKPISLTFDGVLPYNSWDGSLIGWMVSQLAVAPLSAIDTVLDSSSVSVVQVALHGLEVYGVYSTGYEFSDTHLVFLVGTKPSYARAFIATVTTDTTDILQQSVVTNVSNLNVQLIGEPDRGALGFGKAIRVFQVKYNQNVTFRLADLGLMSELTDLESVHAFILANAVDAVTVGSTQLSGEADSHWGAAVGLGDLRYELYGSRSPECFPTDPFCLLNRVVTVTPRKSTVQTFDITMRIISKVSANSSSFNSLSAVTTFARCRVVVAPAPNTTPLLVLNSTAVAMMEDVVGSFMLVVASTSDRDESNVVEVEVSFDPQFLDGIQLDGSAVVTPTTTGVVVLISRAEAVVSAMNRVVSLVPHRNYAGNFSVQVFVSSIERSTGTSNQISTNVSVNVTAVADAPALKVSSTDIRVNQSVPGELTIISAALMDDDGSESLRLELIDPVGALQAAEVSGGGKFVKDHEGGRFVLTPLPLAASTFLLRLNGTASWFGSTQLQLNAVSREASNGNEAVSSINVVLTVLPVADPPTVVVENTRGQLAQSSPVGLITVGIPAEGKLSATNLTVYLVPKSTDAVEVKWQSQILSLEKIPDISSSAVYRLPSNSTLKQPTITVNASKWVSSIIFEVVAVSSISVSSTSQRTAKVVTVTFAGLRLSATSYNLTEGANATLYLTMLSAPLGLVTVMFSSSLPSKAVTASVAATFTSTDWSVTKSIQISAVNNYMEDADAVATISTVTTSTDPLYANYSIPAVVVQVLNDDVAGFVVYQGSNKTSVPALVVAEARVINDTYNIVLQAQPTADVSVALKPSVSILVVAPTSVTFTPENWNASKAIAVTADGNDVVEGDRFTTISSVVTSSDPLYAKKTIGVINVKITETKDATPPPKILDAKFVDTAIGLTITFDRAVDRTTFPTDNFACSVLFDLPAADSTGYCGLSPTCTWQTGSASIRLMLGQGAKVAPGSTLTLRGSVLKSTAAADLTTSATNVTISAPDKPPQPLVLVNGATSLGMCDDLFLDGSSSTGSGGRSMTYTWKLASTTSVTPASLDAVTALLTSTAATNNATIKIAASGLEAGGTYSFILQAKNFFGKTGNSSEILVKKSGTALPSVSIKGGNAQSTYRANELVITASASYPSCSGMISTDSTDTAVTTGVDMTFTWLQVTGDLTATQFKTISPNPRVLKLPARTLTVGVNYVFRLLVAMTSNSKVNNSADVQITVARTELTVLIAAGNRSVGVEQDLVLDASLSVDPDDVANAVPMKYAWACWILNPTTKTYSVPCVTAAGSTLALDTQAKVTVAANTVNPNAVYKFTATVSKDSRSSTASAFITMTPGSPPQVSIEPLGAAKVNSNDRVVLKGKAVSKLPVTKTEWTIVGASDAMMKSIFAVPQGRLIMLLSEGKLTPGVSYKFQLNATDSSGQTGSATLTVVANSPPSSGSLSVTPSIGYALEDKFSVLASDWVDEDLPLKYTFKYIKGSAYSGESEIALGASTPDALFVSQLGLGGGNNNTITLVVYVQDALGASTRVTKEIQVKQMEVAAADQAAYLANKTNAVLAEALTGDPGKVLNTINALADMVNGKEETPTTPTPGGTVPTPAPTALKSCPTSNHVECAGKGTCLREPQGCLASNLDCTVTCKCTSGYYGDNCALDESAMAAKSAALGSLLGAMTKASASVDVTDVGALEQQAASVVTLTKSATILDSSSQNLVLNFMDNILAAPVLTPAATTAVGNTISNLLEIDNSGTKKAATVTQSRRLDDTSTNSSSTNSSDEFFAEKARVAQVASTIGKLQAAMISSAVAGEDPVTLVTKNLRLVGARDTASQFEGRQVQLPLTDAQIAANYTPASTTVPSGFAAYLANQTASSSSSVDDEEDPVVDFQSSVFAKNPYAFDNTSMNSRVMTVKVSSNGEEVAVNRLKTPFRLLMRNLEPITLASNASDNSTSSSGSTTVGEAQVYTFFCLEGTIDIKSFNCTDIVEPMTVQCNGSSYAGEATCPVRQPACKYWDTVNGTWSSDGCKAAGTTDDGLYTICECTHLTDFSSEVSQSVSVVTEHFMNVVTHEVTAEDVEQNLLLILVMAGFFLLYIVSFFYVNRWDYRDRRKAMRASRQLKKGKAAPEKVKLRSLFQEPEYVQAKSWQSKLRAVVFGFGRGLKQNHKILSIIFKYHESFSRPQRLTIVFTLVASKMFTNALLYQLRKGPKTLGSAIISAVITTLFMLPVGFVFMMLFKKAGRMQKQVIRYQVEDDAGNIVEVETDAYGRAKEYSPAEQLSMDFEALTRSVNMSALRLIHDKLKQPREDGPRDPLETRSGQVCRGIFLVLYNREAGSKSSENAKGYVNDDPLAGVLVQIKSHLQEQKRRGTTEDTRRQSRLLRALPPAAPILPPPVVRIEEEVEDPAARKTLALNQLCTMLKRDGGAAMINGMLKFDPLLVSAASATSIAQICARLNILEEEEEEDTETEEDEEVKAVLALQAWLVKCNECCKAQDSSARVVAAKAQAELQQTEKELRKLRIAIGNQFNRRVTEAVVKEMNGPDVNDLIAKTRQSVRRVSRRPSSAVKAEANARDDRRRITVTVKKETQGVLKANNKQLVEKRKAVKKAKHAAVTEQRQLKREAKHEQKKILEGLRGIARLKKRLRLYLEAREERRVAALPLHLREAYLKEKEQLKKIRRTSRLLYNAFLRRQPAHQAKPLFPEWVVYLSYSICAVWSGWCIYFVLMFAFTIGSVEAQLWVTSLLFGLALTYLLLDPVKLFFRMGLMPIVAAGILTNAGFFSALSSEPIALGAAAVAAGAGGMAGYIAKHHADRRERRQSRQLTKGSGNKLHLEVEKEEVVEIAGRMNSDDEDSDDQVEQVQAITDHTRLGVRDSVFSEAASRTNTLVEEVVALTVKNDPLVEMVRPSTKLEPLSVTKSPSTVSDRVQTENQKTLRTVTCRAGCGLSMQARGWDAHERSHCRLTMCECGKMILTQSLEFHRLHECSVDAEADDDDSPVSPRVIPAERGQVVPCRLPGCTESMRAGKREAHERHECSFRLVTCPRCGVEKRAAELATHISRGCDQRRQSQLTLCACGKMIRTEAMDAHRKECSGRARAASVASPNGARVPVTDCASDVSTVEMKTSNDEKRTQSQLSLCSCGKLLMKGAAHSCTGSESTGRELQPLLVNCRLPGCNARVRAALREGHERHECSFRMIACKNCGVEKQATDMDVHVAIECEPKRVRRGPPIPDSPGTRTHRSKSLQVKPELSPPRGRPVGPTFTSLESDEMVTSPIRRKKVSEVGLSPPPAARVVPSPRDDQVEAEVAGGKVEEEESSETFVT